MKGPKMRVLPLGAHSLAEEREQGLAGPWREQVLQTRAMRVPPWLRCTHRRDAVRVSARHRACTGFNHTPSSPPTAYARPS